MILQRVCAFKDARPRCAFSDVVRLNVHQALRGMKPRSRATPQAGTKIRDSADVLPKNVKVVGVGGCGVDYLASVAAYPRPDEKLRTEKLEVSLMLCSDALKCNILLVYKAVSFRDRGGAVDVYADTMVHDLAALSIRLTTSRLPPQ